VFLTANHPKCIVLDDDWAYWLEASVVGARARWANKKDKSTDFFDTTTIELRDCAIAGDDFYTAKIAAGRGIEVAAKRAMTAYASTRNVAPIAIAVVGGGGGGRYWLDDDGTLKGCQVGDCTAVPDYPNIPPPTVLAAAPSGQAIATDGLFVFWTSDDGTVTSIDRGVDAGSPIQLASGQQKPRGIAVDATHVYWATQLGGTIVKVPKGGGTSIVLTTGVDRPRAIAIDATHVYWASDLAGTIGRVSKSGGPPAILADNQSLPLRVAVDGTHVYWINDLAEAEAGTTGAVMRVAK
jgi:hypothetical protein